MSQQSVNRRTTGRLYITVVEARNLAAKTSFGSGTPDPYCSISVGTKKFRTKTKHDLSPIWHEGPFICDGVNVSDEVKVRIRDKVTVGQGHNFGEVVIPVCNIPTTAEKKIYPLSKSPKHKHSVSGDVVLELKFDLSDSSDTTVTSMSSFSVPSSTPSQESITSTASSSSQPPSISGSPALARDQNETEDITNNNINSTVQTQTNNNVNNSNGVIIPNNNHSNGVIIPNNSNNNDTSSSSSSEGEAGSTSPSPQPLNPRVSVDKKAVVDAGVRSSHSNNSSVDFDAKYGPTPRGSVDLLRSQVTTSSSFDQSRGSVDLSSARNSIDTRASTDVTREPKDPTKRVKIQDPPSPGTPRKKGLGTNFMRAMKRTQSYRQERADKKNQSYRKLFKLPETESVLFDYSAALLRHMLHHGRIYVSQNYICFYSNLFGIKVLESIPVANVRSVEKESKIIVNPGITITTTDNEYHFASFLNREKTLTRVMNVWQRNTKELLLDGTEDSEDSEDTEKEGDSDADGLDDQSIDELTMIISSEADSNANFLHEKDKLQELISAEFPVSVVKFFALFYSDESDFAQRYHAERGDKEMTIEKWSSHLEYGSFRTLTYRAPVRAAIGPSSTRLEETQRYHLTKDHLIVEIVSVMHDIPYGDYFRVESKHEVTAVGEDKCKLSVMVGVNFTKKTFFEGKIKSGTLKESKESFETWVQIATEDIRKKRGTQSSISGRRAKLIASSAKMNEKGEDTQIATPQEVKAADVRNSKENKISGAVSSLLSQIQPSVGLAVIILLFMVITVLYIQINSLSSRIATLEDSLQQMTTLLNQTHSMLSARTTSAPPKQEL